MKNNSSSSNIPQENSKRRTLQEVNLKLNPTRMLRELATSIPQ